MVTPGAAATRLIPLARGVFRGGIVPWPPFGVPVMHKYLRIVREIESCPPLEF